MLVPEQPDNIQTRLRWSLRVLNCRGQTTTDPDPVHWRQRRVQQVLRCCRNFPGWSVGYNWGHAPARRSKPPAVAAVISLSCTTPLAPGSEPPCPASITIRYGGSPMVGRKSSSSTVGVGCPMEKAACHRYSPKLTPIKQRTRTTALPKEKPLPLFLSFALYRMFCHDDFPAVL